MPRRRCKPRPGRRTAQINEHLPIFDLGAVGFQIGKAGGLHRLAAGDMERPEMQTALDDIPFQHAVCEIGEGMRTASFGRVEGSINIVQCDELVTDLEGLHCAWRNIRSGADRDEVFCHDLTEWSETFLH